MNSLRILFDSIQVRIFWFLTSVQKIFFFRFGVFFVTPHDRTIGNTAEELHFALILARRLKKKVIFLRRFSLAGAPRIPNFRIFEIRGEGVASGIWWRSVRVAANLFLSVVGHGFAFLFYLAVNSVFLPKSLIQRKIFRKPVPIFYVHYRKCFFHQYFGHELIWRWGFAGARDEVFQFPAESIPWEEEVRRGVSIHFCPVEETQCKSILRSMGLKEGDWFVCLHNREPGYHEDQPDLRNSSIANYTRAIKKIVASGGWVIRMGDASMTRLPEMPNVVDYPFSAFKSEIMDLFLVKNCRFYLGQNSGLVDVAYLFGKQCVLVNTTEWAIGHPRLENSLVIFKHFYSQSLQRFLSVRELLEQPFSVLDLHHFKKDFTLRENSEAEIELVVSELLETQGEFHPFQREFVLKRRKQLLDWMRQPLYEDLEQDRIFKYRLYSRAFGCVGTAGRNYLQANWEENSLNH